MDLTKTLAIGVLVVLLVIAGIYTFKPRLFKNLRHQIFNNGGYTQDYSGDQQGTPPYNSASPTSEMQSKDNPSMSLEVIIPKDGSEITTNSVLVQGKTTPNAEISVNDKDLKADSSGNFSTTITLEDGDNEIVVIANDANGNYSEKDIPISVNLP